MHARDETASETTAAETTTAESARGRTDALEAAGPAFAGAGPSHHAVLALQRAAGNQAVMRQLFPNKFNTPPAQTGPPPVLPPEQAYWHAVGLLGSVFDKEQSAKEALTTVWRVYPASDRAKVVRRLDDGGYIDVLIDRLPKNEMGSNLVDLLKERGIEKNKGLAQKFLTRGWFDWQVTDKEALAAAALLDALPEADRKQMYDSWMGKELKENIPGTADYEPAIGAELLEGAILGDFDEDPTLWSSMSQIGMGFIPYAGQVADARDTVAILLKLDKAKWADGWLWAQLALTMIGWVPGVGDIFKTVGRFVLKWLRMGGKALVGGILKQLFKGVLEPALKKALEPILAWAVPRIRKIIREFMEKHQKAPDVTPAPKVDAPKPAPKADPTDAAKAAAKGLDEAAGKSLERSVKGGKAAGNVIDAIVDAVRENLKAFANKAFAKDGKLDPTSFPWPGIEGDWLVIYGKGSTVRLIRVRVAAVKKFVVEKTEKLAAMTAERSKLLKQAASEADEAVENLLRKGAIDVTEEIGERVAIMLVKREFGQAAKLIYRGAGSGVVDLVFVEGKRIIVCEAKGGAAKLGFREIGPGVKAQQGTLTYLDDIIANMKRSKAPNAADIAKELETARKDGLLTYVISKTGKLDDTDKPLAAVLSWIRQ